MKKRRQTQKALFKVNKATSYGGDLLKTRKGRSCGRPLAVRKTMHLVLRSTLAKGFWAFNKSENKRAIERILKKFSDKYGVKILLSAYVGNHLHLHVKLSNHHAYAAFIRAVTAAIAMKIKGASRWRPMNTILEGRRFWDRRPFTRVVQGFKDHLNLNEYIRINQFEGCGYSRTQARYILAREWDLRHDVGPP